MSTNSRVMSRDVNRRRADLAAFLAFALKGRSQADLTAAEAIVADVNGYEDTQEALHRVRIHLGGRRLRTRDPPRQHEHRSWE